MSDPKRLDEVSRRIERIKDTNYPVVMGRRDPYRIEERPWKDVPEPSKLAILQDIDWSGVTNRDRAHILLSEVDPGRISDAQRNTLIDMAMTGGVQDPNDGEKPLSAAEAKALHAEWETDYAAARARDSGLDYGAMLTKAASRMPSKHKDKERGHSR